MSGVRDGFERFSAGMPASEDGMQGFHAPVGEEDLTLGEPVFRPDEVLSGDPLKRLTDRKVEEAVAAYQQTLDIVVGDNPSPYSPEVRRVVGENMIEALVRDTLSAARDYLTGESPQ